MILEISYTCGQQISNLSILQLMCAIQEIHIFKNNLKYSDFKRQLQLYNRQKQIVGLYKCTTNGLVFFEVIIICFDKQ